MQAAGGAGSWLFNMIPIVAIFAVFYFILIRPAQKQQKQKEAMLAALKKGDRVVTSGGIYGSVTGVEDQVVVLRVADNVKIRVARSAIGGLVDGDGSASG